MELRIQIFGRIYSLCIGYKTEWFGQSNWLTVCRVWYDGNQKVSFAKMCFSIL